MSKTGMDKHLFCAMTVALCAAVFALPTGEKIYLWPKDKMPDRQPHQIAATVAETKAPGYKADENREPHLQWYEAPR